MFDFSRVRSPIILALPDDMQTVEVAAYDEGNSRIVSNANLSMNSPFSGKQLVLTPKMEKLELSSEDVQNFVPVGTCPSCHTKHIAHSEMADLMESANSQLYCLACGTEFASEIDPEQLVMAMAIDAESGNAFHEAEIASDDDQDQDQDDDQDLEEYDIINDDDNVDQDVEEEDQDQEVEEEAKLAETSGDTEDCKKKEEEEAAKAAESTSEDTETASEIAQKTTEAVEEEAKVEEPAPVLASEQVFNLTAGLDWSKGFTELVLSGYQGESRCLVVHNGQHVATLYKEKASADISKIFGTEGLATAFITTASKGMTDSDKANFGYEPVSVNVKADEIIAQKLKEEVENASANLQQEYNHKMDVFKQSLSTAALASVKGLWPKFSNPVRDRLVTELATLGVTSPEGIVNNAFVTEGGKYFKNLIENAFELASRSDDARSELAHSVAEAVVQPFARSTAAARLVDNLTLPSEVASEEVPAQKPMSYREKSRMFLQHIATR